MSFYNVFKTIVTFGRVKNKQKRFFFLSDPEILPCFELNYKFLERHKKPQENKKTRKSCEHGPENGKTKFNQKKNGGSARVDCHIYRRRNKYLQRRHGH